MTDPIQIKDIISEIRDSKLPRSEWLSAIFAHTADRIAATLPTDTTTKQAKFLDDLIRNGKADNVKLQRCCDWIAKGNVSMAIASVQ